MKKFYAVYIQYPAMWPKDFKDKEEQELDEEFTLYSAEDQDRLYRELLSAGAEILDSQGIAYGNSSVCQSCGYAAEGTDIHECEDCEEYCMEPVDTLEEVFDQNISYVARELDMTNKEHIAFYERNNK